MKGIDSQRSMVVDDPNNKGHCDRNRCMISVAKIRNDMRMRDTQEII